MVQTNNTQHSKHFTLRPSARLEGFVIVISKKVAKLAVERNRLRRRIREVVRVRDGVTNQNTQGTLYVRKGVDKLTYNELTEEVLQLIK